MRSSKSFKNLHANRMFFMLGIVAIFAVVLAGLSLVNKSSNTDGNSLLAETSGSTSSQWLRLDVNSINGAVTISQISSKDSVLDISNCSFTTSTGAPNPNAIARLNTDAAAKEVKMIRANRLTYLSEIGSQIVIIDERIKLLNESLKDALAVKDYYTSGLSDVVIAPIGDMPQARYIGGKPVYKCIKSDTTGVKSPILVVPYQLAGSFIPGVKYDPNPIKQVELLNKSFNDLLGKSKIAEITPSGFADFAKEFMMKNKKDYIIVSSSAIERTYQIPNKGGVLSPQPRAGMTYDKSIKMSMTFDPTKKDPSCTNLLRDKLGWAGKATVVALVKLFTGIELDQFIGEVEAGISRPKVGLPSVTIKKLCIPVLPTLQSMISLDTKEKISKLTSMKNSLLSAKAAVEEQLKADANK